MARSRRARCRYSPNVRALLVGPALASERYWPTTGHLQAGSWSLEAGGYQLCRASHSHR